MSRRFALVAAMAALLALPGTVSAATSTVTVSGMVHAFTNNSPKINLGDSVQWQANATNTNHTSTADKFSMWNFSLPAGSETTPTVEFDRAGGFAFHCQIHPSMRGTVMVQLAADDTTPVVGQLITITFALSPAPSGFAEQIQKRKAGGTWKNLSAANTGTTVTWTPPRPKTFEFRSRLVQGGVMSNWSPTLSLTVAAH